MKNFVFAFLTFFVLVGLFLSPLVAADNASPIAGEWRWVEKGVSSLLTISPSSSIEKGEEFSGNLASSKGGSAMLFSLGQGKMLGGKVSFTLHSLHPDGCGGMLVSGEVAKSGEEMILLFSPLPPSIACSSAGEPFTVVFKRNTTAVNNSHSPVGGGPTGEVVDRGGPPMGGGPIN